jgi:hypothetical protein
MFCCLLLGGFIVWAQRPPDPPQNPNQEFRALAPPQTGQISGAKLIREGTTFKNLYVSFRQTGDRTVLYTVENNQRYTCLENLALERILAIRKERPERQYWKIDGEFTQFRGENYVLIRHYVIAQAPSPSAPSAVLPPTVP